jgi:hypothetical protein
VEAKCPPWIATLIARCDGERTTRDHIEFIKAQGLVSREVPETELMLLIRSLIAGGFLRLPSVPDVLSSAFNAS